ncbi:MAG: hypothetical protein LBO66_11255 [Deltaproteobacteria bacterium]|jgi:large subunit ribosomal protein L17|nr:hypothetical protein [Deltaproteobacteria bacterium]
MRHRKANIKLGRKASHRKAMFRNMTTSLLAAGSITTTIHKGKVLKGLVDRLVTLARKNTPSSFVRARKLFASHKAAMAFFKNVLTENWFPGRTSGCVFMTPLGPRAGDAATMVKLSLAMAPPEDKAAKKRKDAPKERDRAARVAASQAKLKEESPVAAPRDFRTEPQPAQEPPAAPTESSAEPLESSAAPTESSAEPLEPSAEPTESSAEPPESAAAPDAEDPDAPVTPESGEEPKGE